MALIDYDLFGSRYDKPAIAVKRLRMFEPPEGYYLTCSGGKDSVVTKALCDLAGVKYDAHNHLTTVDPPELVRFVKNQMPDVIMEKPNLSMRQLIIRKQMPPTRLMRYCCEELKEVYGVGRIVVTGVRWAESGNRKKNQGLVTLFDGKTAGAVAQENGASFTETMRGGVVLNLDNSAERRTVEQCYRTGKTLVNPIIDWTDEDVWEFIRSYNVPYCGLYDEGWKRLGCIGCPLGGYATMRRELERWPVYKRLYIRTFDDMLAARIASGKKQHYDGWDNGLGVFRWWIGCNPKYNPDQISLFEE